MASSQHKRQLDCITGASSGPWRLLQLPNELLARVLAQLPPNDIACNVRFVCKEAGAQLKGPQHITVSVGDKPARFRSTDDPGLVVPAHALLGRWGHPGAGSGLTYTRRQQLLCQAARTGSIPALDQLSSSLGCLISQFVLYAAASAGQLDLCRWLLQQHPDPPYLIGHANFDSCVLVREAVGSGNTELVSALLDMGCKLYSQHLNCAIERNDRAMCEWLASRGCPWTAHDDPRDARSSLASRLLLSERHPAAAAALKGNLPLLAWALSHGKDDGSVYVPYHRARLLLADMAHGCPLSTLKQLYQQLYPTLIMHAHVDPRDATAMLVGAACSPTPDWHDKVLWLAGQAPQFPNVAPDLARRLAACKEDAVERVEWLRGRGQVLTGPDAEEELALFAAAYGNLPLLEFLMHKGVLKLFERHGEGAGEGGDAQGEESEVEEEVEEEGEEEGEEDGEEEVDGVDEEGDEEGQQQEGGCDEGEAEEGEEEAGDSAGAADGANAGQAVAGGDGRREGMGGGEWGQATVAAAVQAAGEQTRQSAAEEEAEEGEGEEEGEEEEQQQPAGPEEAEASESDGGAPDEWELSTHGLVLAAMDGCHLHVLQALHARGVSMAGCSMVRAVGREDLPMVQWLMEVQGRLPAGTGAGGEQGRLPGGGEEQGRLPGGGGGPGLGGEQAEGPAEGALGGGEQEAQQQECQGRLPGVSGGPGRGGGCDQGRLPAGQQQESQGGLPASELRGQQQGQAVGAAEGATKGAEQQQEELPELDTQQRQEEQQRQQEELHRRRRRLTGAVMDAASHSKNEGLVRWLRGVGCPWSGDALTGLAEWGSEELLQWAVEQEGCPVPVGGRAEGCAMGMGLCGAGEGGLPRDSEWEGAGRQGDESVPLATMPVLGALVRSHQACRMGALEACYYVTLQRRYTRCMPQACSSCPPKPRAPVAPRRPPCAAPPSALPVRMHLDLIVCCHTSVPSLPSLG